jgi:hypothetical protein
VRGGGGEAAARLAAMMKGPAVPLAPLSLSLSLPPSLPTSLPLPPYLPTYHKTANEYLGLIERAENGSPRACANWTGPSRGQ